MSLSLETETVVTIYRVSLSLEIETFVTIYRVSLSLEIETIVTIYRVSLSLEAPNYCHNIQSESLAGGPKLLSQYTGSVSR